MFGTRATREGGDSVNSEAIPLDELVEACRRPGSGGFEALVDRYSDAIYRTCYLMVRDPEDARDLTQETFVRFHRSLDTYRAETSLKAWLYRIATNLALNRIRDRARAPTVSAESLPESHPALVQGSPGPEEVAVRRMLLRRIETFLDGLSPALRAAAILRFQQQLSYDEIATVLEINVGTVRSRLNAVREMARSLFGGDDW